MSADLELQQFVYELLLPLGVEIVDEPGQNESFPYIVIGDTSADEAGDNCDQIWDISFSVRVWSRSDGYKEAKTLQGQINNALRWQSAVRDGYRIIKIFPATDITRRDGDGETREGEQTFRALVAEYAVISSEVPASSSEAVSSSEIFSSEILSSSSEVVSSEPPVPFEIWAGLGQSNAAGRSVIDPLIDIEVAGLYQFGNYSVDAATFEQIVQDYDPLRHPDSTTNGSPQRTGPVSWFGRHRVEDVPGSNVLLMPGAQGGTPLVTGSASWGVGGLRYTSAIEQTNKARTAALAMHPDSTFAGIVFQQGESDGDAGVTAAQYAPALINTINGLRAGITGAADSVFIIGGMVPEAITNRAGYPAIDFAHRYVADTLAKCVYVAGRTGYSSDNLHYNILPGVRLVGEDWAVAVPVAQAATAPQYTFESDTVGSAPANVTAVNGSFEVINTGSANLVTKYMRSTQATQQSLANVANLDLLQPAFVNQVLTFRRGYSTQVAGTGRDGFILRPQSDNNGTYTAAKNGYHFQIFSNASLRIYKFTTGAATLLRNVAVATNSYTWFRATVTGTGVVTLDFQYSADGVSWTSIGSVTDSSSPFNTTTGPLQYIAGFTGTPALCNIDNLRLTEG